MEFTKMPTFADKKHSSGQKEMATSLYGEKNTHFVQNEKDDKLHTITEFLKGGL